MMQLQKPFSRVETHLVKPSNLSTVPPSASSKVSTGTVKLSNISTVPIESSKGTKSALGRASLLAVVTGGWALKEYQDDQHFFYLETILRNYVEMCENGLRVAVHLITYESPEESPWENFAQTSKYGCHRAQNEFSIEVHKFRLRPLPQGSFGTAGDLAFRHREIFSQNVEYFDLFVSQEDDVSVTIHAVEYFAKHAKILRKTRFYPGFVFHEMDEGRWYNDYRMRKGSIFMHDETLLFASKLGTSPCMYMLTREDLLHFNQTKTWLDVHSVRGEFNVAVGTYAFMHGWRVIVLPVEDWESATYHHMSNRYRKLSTPDVGAGNPLPGDSPLTFQDQSMIFSSCLDMGEGAKHLKHATGSCKSCLDAHKGVTVEIDLFDNENGTGTPHANFHCTESIYLESYEGKLFPDQKI